MSWFAVLTAVKKIPWQLWLTGLFLLSCFLCYKMGQRDIRKEWAAAAAYGKQVVNQLQDDQKTNTVAALLNFKLQETKIHEKFRTITKEIPIYIPAESKLPNGFLVLYNSSVSDIPLARPSEGMGTYSLALRDAAPIILRNNEACLLTSAKHESFWDWYMDQKRLVDAAREELQQRK